MTDSSKSVTTTSINGTPDGCTPEPEENLNYRKRLHSSSHLESGKSFERPFFAQASPKTSKASEPNTREEIIEISSQRDTQKTSSSIQIINVYENVMAETQESDMESNTTVKICDGSNLVTPSSNNSFQQFSPAATQKYGSAEYRGSQMNSSPAMEQNVRSPVLPITQSSRAEASILPNNFSSQNSHAHVSYPLKNTTSQNSHARASMPCKNFDSHSSTSSGSLTLSTQMTAVQNNSANENLQTPTCLDHLQIYADQDYYNSESTTVVVNHSTKTDITQWIIQRLLFCKGTYNALSLKS